MADYLPLRLIPGADLRQALLAAVSERGIGAAFVVAGIGSLREAQLRFAGAAESTPIPGDLEILTLSGTIGTGGAHLHAAVSDVRGSVRAGHVAEGCVVRTTAEVLLLLLPDVDFAREVDPCTGFQELVVHPHGQKKG
jgi:predicted DNA-binding protein with PD1-like motif